MALIRKRDATRVLPVLGMLIEVGVDGGPFQELKGASLVDIPSGQRSVNQVPTLRGPGATVGAKPVETGTFDLGAVNPNLKVMDDLDRADRQQLNVRVRMSIFSRNILAPVAAQTATVAAPSSGPPDTSAFGGAVTFVGEKEELEAMVDADEILVSDLIQIGGTDRDSTYIVNAILVDSETNSITTGAAAGKGVYLTDIDVSDATVVGAAATVGVRTAGWRQRFSGLVAQFGSISGDASGSPSLASGLMITPHALLGRPSVLITGENALEA